MTGSEVEIPMPTDGQMMLAHTEGLSIEVGQRWAESDGEPA
jgi:hypothetical protein